MPTYYAEVRITPKRSKGESRGAHTNRPVVSHGESAEKDGFAYCTLEDGTPILIPLEELVAPGD